MDADPYTTCATSSTRPSEQPGLTTDLLIEQARHLRDDLRRRFGPSVHTLKLGRAQVEWLRQMTAQPYAGYADALAPPGTHLYGIPCYEVDRESYLERLEGDEAPDLDALNRWLVAEPAAVWGPVRAAPPEEQE